MAEQQAASTFIDIFLGQNAILDFVTEGELAAISKMGSTH